MKRVFLKVVCLLVCVASLLSFGGCAKSKQQDFKNGLFIESTISPVFGDIMFMYATTVSVYSDGTVVLSASPYYEDYREEPPTITLEKSEREIESLQKDLVKAGCFELPEQVDTDSEDGAYHAITVFSEDSALESSGLNPDNKKFVEVERLVWSFAGGASVAELAALMDDYFTLAELEN